MAKDPDAERDPKARDRAADPASGYHNGHSNQGDQGADESDQPGKSEPDGDVAADNGEQAEKTPAKPSFVARHKWLFIAPAAILALVGIGWFGWHWWTVGRFLVATNDAYLRADNVVIASRVAGYVAAVLVDDNQQATKGGLLIRIVNDDYRARVTEAEGNVAISRADIANTDAQLLVQGATIEEARANVASAVSDFEFQRADFVRYNELARTQAASRRTFEVARNRLQQAEATEQRNRANLSSAERQLQVLSAQRQRYQAELQANEANRELAQINLADTIITAGEDGVIGNRGVRVGQYVDAGTELMTLVPLQAVYLIANYKETQLERVRRGQPVEVVIDSFPDIMLPGIVDSVAPASGAEFSTLPPDNATGNFTKIVQRIPVKIVFDPTRNPLAGKLRPGMSATPTVDTRGEGDRSPQSWLAFR